MSEDHTYQSSANADSACEPGNSYSRDQGVARYDDPDGLDWDQIIADSDEDERENRVAFDSDDYPDHESAAKALRAWIHGIFERALDNEITTELRVDGAR